jgi:hypothetical protein
VPTGPMVYSGKLIQVTPVDSATRRPELPESNRRS